MSLNHVQWVFYLNQIIFVSVLLMLVIIGHYTEGAELNHEAIDIIRREPGGGTLLSVLIRSDSYLFLFICFEYDSFITKPDIVRPNPSLPFYRLLVPIAWLNLILLNKSNERYSVAVCLDIIIIINIISDIIIISNIDRSYEYILNLSIYSFTVGIIFTFMTAFSLSYQRMFKYNNSTSLPALCFCIELLLLFIMIIITFIAQYKHTYFEWLFSVFAFINFIYPNVPFHKTFLMYSFVKWSTSEIYQFVIKNSNDTLEDMCIRLHCYLHREIQHKNSNGYCIQANCWIIQYNFLKLNNTEKLKTIYKLINNGENWKKIEKLQTQRRFIYFLSSIISLVFPFWWFHLTMGQIDYAPIKIFFYGLNILYLCFNIYLFIYLVWKVRWTFAKLKIMMLIFSHRENTVQYSVAKLYLHSMYHNLPTINSIMQCIHHNDIALIILSYVLTTN